MPEFEILVKSVEGMRLTHESKEDSKVIFSLHASLSETERNPGSLALKFEIELNTQPAVAKISLTGTAIARGESEEILKLTTAKDGSDVPPILMQIYQKVYAIIYLLCGSLKIPYPEPGLLKTAQVRTDRDGEIPQPLQSEGKPQTA